MAEGPRCSAPSLSVSRALDCGARWYGRLVDAPETAAAWLAVLLNGSVGSVLGLAGLFLTFWLTLRADRKRDARRRDEEARRASADRTRNHTADLLTTLSSTFSPHDSLEGFRKWEEGVEAAMMRFALLEQGPHPEVSGWMLAQTHGLAGSMGKAEAALEADADPFEAMKEVSKRVGRTAGIITMWAAGKRDDKWFEGRGHKYSTGMPS